VKIFSVLKTKLPLQVNIRNWRNGLKNIGFNSGRTHSVSVVPSQNDQQSSGKIVPDYNVLVTP